MEKELQLKDLYDGFRDAKTIKAFKQIIDEDLKDYDGTINIMEVCGGHTHTIMKYGIPQLLNKNKFYPWTWDVLFVLCQKIELIVLML